jgi:serine/threonine protein kinase
MTSHAINPADAPELGKYRLIAKLARGGMGDVYLAVAQGPGGFHKLLAVKEMRPEFVSDERYVTMFLEEARLAARLHHPNIVQTNEVGTDGGRHYMTMEYLDGRSLYRVGKQFAKKRGGLPLGAHLRVIAEALLGLHYAHELCGFDGDPLGIVHRDVSPLNVFVTFDGQAKVLDFGIAKSVDSSIETQAGILKGRLAYMAPEQACASPVDRRADVYAAGVVIWEAVAGRRLWPGMGDVEIYTRTIGEGPPALLSVCPTAPPELAAVCDRAMARRPEDRYPSAAALLEDLDRHLRKRDDSVSMRELGAMVSAAFEDERRQMNATIEEALIALRAGPQSGVMSTRTTEGSVSRDPARVSIIRDELANLASLLSATPSRPASAQGASRDDRDDRDRPLQPFRSYRPPVPTLVEGSARARRRKKRRSAATVLALGFAAIASVGAGMIMLRSGRAGLYATVAAPAAAAVGAVQGNAREGAAGGAGLVPATAIPTATAAPSPSSTPTPILTGPARAAGFAPGTGVATGGGNGATQSAARPAASAHAAAPAGSAAPGARPARPDPARGSAGSTEGAPTPSPVAFPATSAAAPRPEGDPSGGHAPLHPIVTSNPYGAL